MHVQVMSVSKVGQLALRQHPPFSRPQRGEQLTADHDAAPHTGQREDVGIGVGRVEPQ